MGRVFPWCGALVLVMLLAYFVPKQVGRADDLNDPDALEGRYAFTLTEKCTHQLNVNVPGFDSNFNLVDPKGAETYCGASDGFLIFDGHGGAKIANGRATNIMEAQDRILQPTITPIPLGFGLGPALPFTCHGSYTVKGHGPGAKITVPLTCDAVINFQNALGTTGFESTFSLEGTVPRNKEQLVLTDIGNTVQPVTIFFPGNPPPSVHQQRICTRAVSAVLVSED